MAEKGKENEDLKLVLERQTEKLRLSLALSDDRLRLFMDCELVTPEQSANLTAEDIYSIIAEAIDRGRVDANLINDIVLQLQGGQAVHRRRIARGKETQDGRDGRLVLLAKPFRDPRTALKVEVIDSRFIRFFDNIEKGSVVGRIYPPTPGTDGEDAFGATLKASPGKVAKITLDKSISATTLNESDGFQSLVAEDAGYLLDKGGKLSIQPELLIEGDIDFTTGDIDFICKVVVKGNVMKGFTVQAGGDIEVTGNVFGGSLISRSGSVKVKGRILGDSAEEIRVTTGVTSAAFKQTENKFHAVVKAANLLRADSLEHADVEAECDVEILNEARDSSIWTKGLVRLVKGHLFGGKTFSACGLEAKILGTPSEAHTEITLSSDVEATKFFLVLLKEIKKVEDTIETCNLYLGPIVSDPKRLGTLSPNFRKKTEELLHKLSNAQQMRAELLRKKEEALVSARENNKLRVNVHGEFFPGVNVIVGECTFKSSKKLTGPLTIEFNADTNDFEVVELRNLECVVPEHCVLPS